MILAGDVGGTKTNLALFSVDRGRLISTFSTSVRTHDFPNPQEMLRQVPFEPSKISSACLGVPGAVIEGVSNAVNLPWQINAGLLASSLTLPALHLINDLEATAYGISELSAEQLRVIAPGSPTSNATKALIAAGTGLGESLLYWDGQRHIAIPTEGGLADFAPRNPLKCELHEYLRKRYTHVSWERVVSGPGLCNLYNFLKDTGRGVELEEARDLIRMQDPATVISDFGLQRKCPLCSDALDLFVSLYGAESGNLGLHTLAFGGIYLGGGIAPKIASRLAGNAFVKAFVAKDRVASILSTIPIFVILEEKTALLGAARYAALHM